MKKSYFGLKIGKAFSSPVSASEPSIMIGKILKYTLKVVSVLVAIVLLILLAVFSLWLSARIFRLGMLRYGQRVRLREAFEKGK